MYISAISGRYPHPESRHRWSRDVLCFQGTFECTEPVYWGGIHEGVMLTGESNLQVAGQNFKYARAVCAVIRSISVITERIGITVMNVSRTLVNI